MTERAGPEHTYLDRRRRRRRLVVLGIALASLLVAVTARRPDLDDPCDAPSAAPASQLALLPSGLSLERIGTVTRVWKEEPHVMVRAVTTKPRAEVTVLIQDAVVAAGYRPAGAESEEHEAAVFFTTGPYAGGQARVQQSACAGLSDVDLVLLDRDAVPAGTTLPTTNP